MVNVRQRVIASAASGLNAPLSRPFADLLLGLGPSARHGLVGDVDHHHGHSVGVERLGEEERDVGTNVARADDTHLVDAQIPEAVAHVHFLPARRATVAGHTRIRTTVAGESPLTEDQPRPSIFYRTSVRNRQGQSGPPDEGTTDDAAR